MLPSNISLVQLLLLLLLMTFSNGIVDKMFRGLSNKWLEQSNVHADNAKRCLALFLDAFKNLILEPLVFQKDRLTESIRVENDTDREIELSREKIILDKKIRKTSLDLKKMITTILENS